MGLALVGLLLVPAAPFAAEESASGSEEIFNRMYDADPADPGTSVEEAIRRFYWEGEEDLGTYPPSDIWDRDFELRRKMPPTLDFSGRMDFRYSDDEISGIEKWEKEFELFADYGSWDAMFRFSDVNSFASQQDPFRWEKGRIRYRDGKWKITAGSYGTIWGKGLSVNMFESRILDFDNEAEGLKAEYTDGPGRVEVIYGWDKDRKDDTLEFEIGNSNKEIVGMRGEYRLSGELAAGANVVNVQFPSYTNTLENPESLDYDILGADLTFRHDDISAYYEIAALDRSAQDWAPSDFDFMGINGKANYLNIGYYGNSYSIVTEYADYQGMDHPFNVLPPIRRWQEAASADADDFVGYGSTLTWNPFDDSSYFQFSYEQDYLRHTEEPHSEFGINYFSPNYGRFNYILAHWQVYDKFTNHDQTKLTLAQQLDHDYSLGVVLEREEIGFRVEEKYLDYIAELDFFWRSEFAASYLHEWTGGLTADGKDEWGVWEFKYHPDEEQEWHLTYGDRREGFVCSGGICRLEPAFDGIKAQYLRRF
jgi:hypothetical protein